MRDDSRSSIESVQFHSADSNYWTNNCGSCSRRSFRSHLSRGSPISANSYCRFVNRYYFSASNNLKLHGQ